MTCPCCSRGQVNLETRQCNRCGVFIASGSEGVSRAHGWARSPKRAQDQSERRGLAEYIDKRSDNA